MNGQLRENIHMVSKRLRLSMVIAAFWIMLAGFVLIEFLPNIPRTILQWSLFVAFGPPLFVLAGELFGWIFSVRHGYAISDAKFSILRILIALPFAIAWLLCCWRLSWLISK